MGPEGAEAVLKVRAIITSHFDAYWRFHLRREHERIHNAKYRDTYILAAYNPAHLKRAAPFSVFGRLD
jgi:hypothetical protein